MLNRIPSFIVGCISLLLSAHINAQELSNSWLAASSDPPADSASVPTVKERAPGKLYRWLELQTAMLGHRYRFLENSAAVSTGIHQFNDSFQGRFKFDAKGKYSLNIGVYTGNAFVLSWDDSGWGGGQSNTTHYLKQLYFAAQPIKGIEVQYGSLYIKRGESTEITTYDNDGYIMGGRLTLSRPKELFFNEIAVTYAYLGDANRPNINKRYNRLRQANYHQFLVSKNLGNRAIISADYTFQSGIETLHEGITLITPELRVIDNFRFENYQRIDVNAAYGFALNAEKSLYRRFTVGGGYADIDINYGGLNSDRFNKGRRLYLTGNVKLNSEFSLATFWTRAVANDFTVSNCTRLDVVLNYNLLETLRRAKFF